MYLENAIRSLKVPIFDVYVAATLSMVTNRHIHTHKKVTAVTLAHAPRDEKGTAAWFGDK